MHKIQTIVTAVFAMSVRHSVRQSACHAAQLGFIVQKRIKILFGLQPLDLDSLHSNSEKLTSHSRRVLTDKFSC